MKILVTGARGLVGRALVRALLARHHEVHAVARSLPADRGEAHWWAADLLEPLARKQLAEQVRPELAFHLAWTTEHGRYWTDPANEAWLAATTDLAARVLDLGAKLFLSLGTCAEYDWTAVAPTGFDARTGPFGPHTPYGVAKLQTARFLERHAPAHHLWCRLFFVHGPGEHRDRVLPAACRALVRGEPLALGPCSQVIDTIHSDELAEQLIALATSSERGAVNLGSGQPGALREVLLELADMTHGREHLLFGARPARPAEPPFLFPALEAVTRVWSNATPRLVALRRTLDYWTTMLREER